MFVIPVVRDGRIYCGPVDTLERYRAGEIVTESDLLTDQSLWTVEVIEPEAGKRLEWMLQNLVIEDGRMMQRRG